MKSFWKVLGLAALVSSIPFKAEKDEQGELKNMTALLWKYDRKPSDVYVDEVHHELSIGLNLPDFKKAKEKVTDAFSRAKEGALHIVEMDDGEDEKAAEDAQDEAQEPVSTPDAISAEDFADNDAE